MKQSKVDIELQKKLNELINIVGRYKVIRTPWFNIWICFKEHKTFYDHIAERGKNVS